MLDKNEEKLLINKIRDGDVKAQTKVYVACKEYFLNVIASRYPSIAEKEMHVDIYQEVMMIFIENIKSGKLTDLTCRIHTYLVRVGLFHLSNILRRLNRESKIIDEYEILEIEHNEQMVDEEGLAKVEQELYQHLEKLDASCKTIIRLSFFEMMSNAEIAKQLNLNSSKKVAQKKWLCLEKLRNLFNKN